MTTNVIRPPESGGKPRELVQLVRRIQALTLDLHELRRREASTAELDANERRLEQLRSRLAAVARRTASDDVSAAA